MSDWRFIVDYNSYADFSVSVSPAIEKAVVTGEAPPTVYLCMFDADSITIGVNEDPEQSLDLAFCDQHKIAFRRRLNGGKPGQGICGRSKRTARRGISPLLALLSNKSR